MSSPEGFGERITFVHFLSILLQRRRLIAAVPLALLIALAAIGLLPRRTYTVSTTFMPQSTRSSSSQLAGLAAQFGVAVSTGESGESLEFYASLVRSTQLLRGLVDAEYSFESGGKTIRGTLVEIYGFDDENSSLARDAAVRHLRGNYAVSIKNYAGLVTVAVTSNYPALSLEIAEKALSLVNRFNQETRQSQAGSEREFIEDRLQEVEGNLREAEDRLASFLEQNRQFGGSPELAFEHDRLQRRVVMRQQVYTSLVQAYEQARIDEVRNTPVITTVEKPAVPARPDSRRLVLRGLIALVLGSLVGVLWAVGLAVLQQGRAEAPEDADRLRRLQEETLSDISHPWRLIRLSRKQTGQT